MPPVSTRRSSATRKPEGSTVSLMWPSLTFARAAPANCKAHREYVIFHTMTKQQIEAVLERVRHWPRQRQEDAARVLQAMEAESTEPYRLSGEERADIEAALEELARGEVATDAEAVAVFDRLRQ